MSDTGKVQQQSGNPANSGSAVAALLQSTRVRGGEDLREISQVLCIRHTYLDAIEGGRFGELPGPTYATGFVRAYADHLGLDGDEIVRRFKAETDSLRTHSRLAFPMPVSEERVPTGAAILVGAVLAILIYGGWALTSSSDDDIADLIPALPDRLFTLLQGQPKPVPPVPPSGSAPADNVMPPAEGEQAEDTDDKARRDKAMAALIQPPPVVQQPALGTPAQPAPPGQPQAGQPAQPASQPTPPPVAAPAAQPPVQTAVAAPPAAAEPADAIQSAPGPDGRVFGIEHGDARVVLRARGGDSWIQVTDRDHPVLTRLLRRGESFRVPNRGGLTLFAGNLGTLEVLVDGKPTAALGSAGKTRRNISLDPDRLRAEAPAPAPATEAPTPVAAPASAPAATTPPPPVTPAVPAAPPAPEDNTPSAGGTTED